MGVKENKFRYFLYSEEQLKEKNEVMMKQGKIFVPGTVYVGNSRIRFTQLSDKDNMDRYIDVKVVAKGYLNQLRYELPKTSRNSQSV